MATTLYAQRRKALLEAVRQQYPERAGTIILWAAFEQGSQRFIQDASFYYFTGLAEPGCALCLDVQTGTSVVFVPNVGDMRVRWVGQALSADAATAQRLGVDEVRLLGQPLGGYTLHPLFAQPQYENMRAWLHEIVRSGGSLFAAYPATGVGYEQSVAVIQRLSLFQPTLQDAWIDISPLIARMRRKKGREEIELIYKAVALTHAAQQAAAQYISAGRHECEVQAAIEYVFTSSGATSAFVPIVASGAHAAIMHYQSCRYALQKGEVVIVDCGACFEGYCADVSRTYPVSKKFSESQKTLYGLVLQAHDYVASLIKPGMYLNNAAVPEQSLHHCAMQFFAKHGCEQFFNHGIGHFLGLEVHDVGDPREPLQEGDVITIEPGLYRADQGIGVRIENDFWVIKDGAHNLSEDLPVSIDEVQAMIG